MPWRVGFLLPLKRHGWLGTDASWNFENAVTADKEAVCTAFDTDMSRKPDSRPPAARPGSECVPHVVVESDHDMRFTIARGKAGRRVTAGPGRAETEIS